MGDYAWLVTLAVWLVVHFLRLFYWSVAIPTDRCIAIHPGVEILYWLAVFGGLYTGTWGLAKGNRIFAHGEDIAGFERRAGWLGWPAKVIRAHQRINAHIAGSAIVGGYGTAAVLLAAGWLGPWLAVPPLAAAAGRVRRRRRQPW
jgi:hypothetical protein